MKNPSTPIGIYDIPTLCELFKLDFFIIRDFGDKSKDIVISRNNQQTIYLFYQEDLEHFDLLLPKTVSSVEGFCQSIVYKTLYENVFNMTHVDDAVNILMNNGNAIFRSKNDKFKKCSYTECNDKKYSNEKNCAKQLLENRILPFPYTVAKGLNPNFVKNVSYDAWLESTDKLDIMSCETDAVAVGEKCLCTLSSFDCVIFYGHIQHVDPDTGACIVFIEQIGEKRTLNLRQIIPICQQNKSSNLFHKKYYTKDVIKSFDKPNNKYNKNFKDNTLKSISVYNKNYSFYNRHFDTDQYKFTDTDIFNEKPNVVEDFNSNIEVFEKKDSASFFKRYTHVEMNYHNFQPPESKIYLYPFIVENDSTSPAEANTTDNRQNQQNFSVSPDNQSSPPAPYINNLTETPPVSVSHPSLPTTPMTYIPFVPQGNIPPPFTPPPPNYPVMFIPPPMPYPRPIVLPQSVNPMAQRSINPNGSDLPYHDTQSLRFFYNLGIDIFQGTMMPPMPTGSPRMMAPVNVPISSYQQISPQQLAIEMQNNLTLEESLTPGHHEPNKNFTTPNNNNLNKNNTPRNNNGRNNENGNKFNRGGYHGRFRKNDYQERQNYRNNGQNFNKPPSNNGMNNANNTNGNRNNGGMCRNNTKPNGTPKNYQDNHGGKENHKDSSQHNGGGEMFVGNIHSPPIPFPPPIPNVHYQYYRLPYGPPDNATNMMPFPQSFMYNQMNEEHMMPPPLPPPGFDPNGLYLGQPPHMYPSNVPSPPFQIPSAYSHPTNNFPPPQQDNNK